MDLKLPFMTHKKTIKKKKKKAQKRRREIQTCNSVDGRFDKAFYYGFHKYRSEERRVGKECLE